MPSDLGWVLGVRFPGLGVTREEGFSRSAETPRPRGERGRVGRRADFALFQLGAPPPRLPAPIGVAPSPRGRRPKGLRWRSGPLLLLLCVAEPPLPLLYFPLASGLPLLPRRLLVPASVPVAPLAGPPGNPCALRGPRPPQATHPEPHPPIRPAPPAPRRVPVRAPAPAPSPRPVHPRPRPEPPPHAPSAPLRPAPPFAIPDPLTRPAPDSRGPRPRPSSATRAWGGNPGGGMAHRPSRSRCGVEDEGSARRSRCNPGVGSGVGVSM